MHQCYGVCARNRWGERMKKHERNTKTNNDLGGDQRFPRCALVTRSTTTFHFSIDLLQHTMTHWCTKFRLPLKRQSKTQLRRGSIEAE